MNEEEFEHLDVNSDDQFEENDKQWINEKLDIILEGLKEFATDLKRIEDDLTYMAYKSNGVSKKDWYTMFMGTFFGWMTSAVIPPEKAHEAWETVQQTFLDGGRLLS
jgi:hypothetical protein